MTREDRSYLTALAGVPALSCAALKRIRRAVLAHQITLSSFWQRSEQWPIAALTPFQQQGLKDFQATFTPASFSEQLETRQILILFPEDPEYPPLLRSIKDHPQVLFVKGTPITLSRPSVAIVGSRQMTIYGKQVTEQLARQFAERGLVITSGCMYGVDVTAQREALALGGHSIGVLGYGFNYSYPRQYREWLKEFVATGNTLVTEYPPAMIPHLANFPNRNRIVAGLSLATVVTEAALRSGSLITAKYAQKYDRVIAAVPGPMNSQFSEGTKWLVNQGAALITSAKEVIDLINNKQKIAFPGSLLENPAPLSTQAPLSQVQQQLYDTLRQFPLTTDELQEQLQLPITEINSQLSLLEIAGMIKQHNYHWITCQM